MIERLRSMFRRMPDTDERRTLEEAKTVHAERVKYKETVRAEALRTAHAVSAYRQEQFVLQRRRS